MGEPPGSTRPLLDGKGGGKGLGKHKDGYEVVETLVYVGEGKGTYNMPAPAGQPGAPKPIALSWQRKVYMCTLVFFLAGGTLSLITSLILGPKRAAPRLPPAQPSPASAHDGVRGAQKLAPPASATAQVLHHCNEQAMDHWSFQERQWCCAQKGIACPDMKCLNGRDDWQHAWSPGKKIWCCQHHNVGCGGPARAPVVHVTTAPAGRPTLVPPHTAAPPSQPHADVTFGGAARAKAGETPAAVSSHSSDPHDCKVDAVTKWSSKKKDWCCWHAGVGCPDS